jgi:hypothetical protein
VYDPLPPAVLITARGERTFGMKPSPSFSTLGGCQVRIYGCVGPGERSKLG